MTPTERGPTTLLAREYGYRVLQLPPERLRRDRPALLTVVVLILLHRADQSDRESLEAGLTGIGDATVLLPAELRPQVDDLSAMARHLL